MSLWDGVILSHGVRNKTIIGLKYDSILADSDITSTVRNKTIIGLK